MRFEKLDNWSKDFRNESLLYFTQRINEMLEHDTEHIFKVPVLNTALLVDEFLKTSKLVSNKIIDKYHLTPIMDEFRFSFKEDIIIKKNIEQSKKNLIINRTAEKFNYDWNPTMEYVKNLLSNYNEWCKTFLFEAISSNKEIKSYNDIKEIEQGIRSFSPGLVALGYSKDFIYKYNAYLFNKKHVNSISVLRTFFDRFDFKQRNYDVYIAIDAGAIHFQKVLKERLSVNFGPFPQNIRLRFDKRKYVLARMHVLAYDEYSASKKAYSLLNIFFTYYCFLAEQTDNWYCNTTKVIDDKGMSHVISLKISYQHRPSCPSAECRVRIADYSIIELQKKSLKSYGDISMTIKLHNTAINDSDINNRFLDFWSTLEILFVSGKKKTKLEEVKDKMIPILLNDFWYYHFSFINSSIRSLEKQKCIKTLKELFPVKDKSIWPFLIALDEFSTQRETLYKSLSDFPLVKCRIMQLMDLCTDKKSISSFLNDHTSRLLWHITRLYRTRNSIIHSGQSPNNLQELLEHLHCYADQCLINMLMGLSNKTNIKSISNFLIDSQLRMDAIYSILDNNINKRDKTPLNKSELLAIFAMNK